MCFSPTPEAVGEDASQKRASDARRFEAGDAAMLREAFERACAVNYAVTQSEACRVAGPGLDWLSFDFK